MKYIMFIFVAALVIMLPVRLYQLFAVTELETGFFTETDISVIILYGLIALSVAAFMILSYISRELPSPMLPVGKNYVLGISSLVFGAALFYDGITGLLKIIPSTASSVQIVLSVAATNIQSMGGYPIVLRILFAFLSFVWLVVFAVSHFGGNTNYKNYKFLALTPVCWALSRLVVYLTNPINFLRIAELLFELFMLLFFMLFFITAARITTGVFSENCMWGIYGYGFSAAVFAALVTIPRLVLLAVGREPVSGYEFEPADLGTLVFILCYIFASFGIGFDDASKNRQLVSEIVLPEDGAVVRKGASRNAEKPIENAQKPLEVIENHGIFKVEDEIIDNTFSMQSEPEQPEPEQPEFEQPESEQPEPESLTMHDTSSQAENADEISPENTLPLQADEDEDGAFLLNEAYENEKKVSDKSDNDGYDELLKSFEEKDEPLRDEAETDFGKNDTAESTAAHKSESPEGNAYDFSAEGFFAESGEDEGDSGESLKGKRKKSSKKKAERLRAAALNAEKEQEKNEPAFESEEEPLKNSDEEALDFTDGKPEKKSRRKEKPVKEKKAEEKPVKEKKIKEKPVKEKPVKEKKVKEKPVKEKKGKKKASSDNEEEIISTVTLKDMKKGKKD